jgi:hypothetical protein
MAVAPAWDRALFAVDVTPAQTSAEFQQDETATTRSHRKGIVVELKPRSFAETAKHFRMVTKTVPKQQDLSDID